MLVTAGVTRPSLTVRRAGCQASQASPPPQESPGAGNGRRRCFPSRRPPTPESSDASRADTPPIERRSVTLALIITRSNPLISSAFPPAPRQKPNVLAPGSKERFHLVCFRKKSSRRREKREIIVPTRGLGAPSGITPGISLQAVNSQGGTNAIKHNGYCAQ